MIPAHFFWLTILGAACGIGGFAWLWWRALDQAARERRARMQTEYEFRALRRQLYPSSSSSGGPER